MGVWWKSFTIWNNACVVIIVYWISIIFGSGKLLHLRDSNWILGIHLKIFPWLGFCGLGGCLYLYYIAVVDEPFGLLFRKTSLRFGVCDLYIYLERDLVLVLFYMDLLLCSALLGFKTNRFILPDFADFDFVPALPGLNVIAPAHLEIYPAL